MNRKILKIDDALNLASMPRVLQATAEYIARNDLPELLSIDLSDVTEVDSTAVSLLLKWRREALRLNKRLRYINLPQNLLSLASLYDVEELIHCPRTASVDATETCAAEN